MTKFKYILLDYVDKKSNNFKIYEIPNHARASKMDLNVNGYIY